MYRDWLTGEMRTWYLPPGETPLYLSYTGVTSIDWQAEPVWTCQYCGSLFTKTPCPGCGSPMPPKTNYVTGLARVTLETRLPQEASFLWLAGDIPGALEVHHSRCRPDNYANGNIVIRLSKCKCLRRYIPSVSALHPDDQALVELHNEWECQVDLYANGAPQDTVPAGYEVLYNKPKDYSECLFWDIHGFRWAAQESDPCYYYARRPRCNS